MPTSPRGLWPARYFVNRSLALLLALPALVFLLRPGVGAREFGLDESSPLTYVAGSLSLSTVIAGEPAYFELTVANGGGAEATLDTTTTLSFGSPETGQYEAPLLASVTVPDGAQAVLRFQSVALAADFPPGAAAPLVSVSGQLGGEGFTQTLAVGDSLTVLHGQPGLAEVTGTLQPTDPSRRSILVLWVELENTTECPVQLGAGSEVVLRDGQRWWQRVPLLQAVTIPPGAAVRVEFASLDQNGYVSSYLRNDTPDGAYYPLFRLFGTRACDGQPFSALIDSAQTTTLNPLTGEPMGMGAVGGSYGWFTEQGGVLQVNAHAGGTDPYQVLISVEISEQTKCYFNDEQCNLLTLDQVSLDHRFAYSRAVGEPVDSRIATAYVHVLATPDMISDLPWQIRAAMILETRPDNCTGSCVSIRSGVRMPFNAYITARDGKLALESVVPESTFVQRGEPFQVAVGARNPESGDPNAPIYPLSGSHLLLSAGGVDVSDDFDQVVSNAGIAIHQANERPLLFQLTPVGAGLAGRVDLGARVPSEGIYPFYYGIYDGPDLPEPYTGPRTVTRGGQTTTGPAASFVYVVETLPLAVDDDQLLRLGRQSTQVPLTVTNSGPWSLTVEPGSTVEIAAMPQSPVVIDTAGDLQTWGYWNPRAEWGQSFVAPRPFILKDIDFILYGYPLTALPDDVAYSVEIVAANADGTLPVGADTEVAPADRLALATAIVPAGSPFTQGRLLVTTPALDVRLEQDRVYYVLFRFSSPVAIAQLSNADGDYPDGRMFIRSPRNHVIIWQPDNDDLDLRFNARHLIFKGTTTLAAPLTLAPDESAVVPFELAQPLSDVVVGTYAPALTLYGTATDAGVSFAYHQRVATATPFVRLTDLTAITGFTPATAPFGATVTIAGTGLSEVTDVAFNGTPASFSVVSDNEITAVVPAGAMDGPLSVSGPYGAATSAAGFIVQFPPTAPRDPTPADGANGVQPYVDLAWSADDTNGDPLTYEVRFGTDNPPPVVEASLNTNTYATGKARNTTYYWQIVARDNNGGETPGPVWSFTTASEPPNEPLNPTPADGATARPVTVTLAWTGGDPDGDPVSYEVRFGTDNPPPQVVAGQSEKTYAPPGELAYHTTYYWQIVARDEFNERPGRVWSFTTLNRPPATPNNPDPADAATGVALDASLTWSGGDPDADPVTYEVRFGTNNPPPQVTTGQSGTTYDPPGDLLSRTTYYWQIVARDGFGGETPGPVWSFTTLNRPPAAPANPSPDNGATGVALDASLTWSGGEPDGDPVTYEVRFGTDNPPPQVVAAQSETTHNPPGDLLPHTTYYWQIVARDGFGEETPGPVWSFTTLNRPPASPTTPNPENGATGVTLDAALAWSGGDPDADPVTYEVRFGATNPPPQVVAAQSEMTYDPPDDLLAHTTYYWQIIARDDQGGEREGPIWSFTTLNRPPAAPAAPNPADGASNTAVTASLSWSAAADPDGDPVTYEVRFGTDSPPPQVVAGQSGTSYNPPGDLDHHTTYYWQIVAHDDQGGETAGPVWLFTTLNRAPFAPKTPNPANGATGVSPAMTLSWVGTEPDGDTLSYEVYFGAANPPPLVVANQSAASYDPPGNLAFTTTYYWQIVAKDAFGGATAGPVWSFATSNQVGTIIPGGNLSEDTTWALTGSPYIVTGDVTVMEGVTLTIEPGVEVRFGEERSLILQGQLVAEGTEAQRILFTRHAATGSWRQIQLTNNASGSLSVQYADVEHSRYGISLEPTNPSPDIVNRISHSRFRFNGRAIYIGHSWNIVNRAIVSYNEFSHNTINNEGAVVVYRMADVHHNIFTANTATWALQVGSDANVEYNLIYGNQGSGVRLSQLEGSFRFNTIVANRVDGVAGMMRPDLAPTRAIASDNNIYGNGRYAWRAESLNVAGFSFVTDNNYWGTTDQTFINTFIFDFWDDSSMAAVIYQSFATDFIADAPPDPGLQVVIPDFDLNAPSTFTVDAGQHRSFTLNVQSLRGPDTPTTLYLDDRPVELSIVGLPREALATLSPAALTPSGQSQITLAASAIAPGGTYTLYVVAEGDGGTHSLPLTLTINSPIPPPPPGPCGWDAYEDNGTPELAYAIRPHSNVLAAVCSPTDDDWYRVYVPVPGSTLDVTLTNLPADYDLFVYSGLAEGEGLGEVADVGDGDEDIGDVQGLENVQGVGNLAGAGENPGTQSEAVTVQTGASPGWFDIRVLGYNGASHAAPYTLRAAITPPAEPPPPDPEPGGGTGPTLPYDPSLRTLILVSPARLGQYYGQAESDAVLAKLDTLAAHAAVDGVVFNLDEDPAVVAAYAAWNPAGVAAANDVAAAIRAVIARQLPRLENLEYLVLVGHDDVIPFWRMPEGSGLGLEAGYLAGSGIAPTTALYHALDEGFYLTDSYYSALQPIPWQGHELYVPELALGRLVETPADMIAVIDAFLSDNQLNASDAVVTGSGFLSDLGQSVGDLLDGYGATTQALIGDGWMATQLSTPLLQQGRDLASLNAAFTHNTLTAAGGGALTSADVADATADLTGRLVFSAGCHSGLNVPDVSSGVGVQTLDFAQAFAGQGATYVANTGTCYGDTDEIALSELVLYYFAQQLGTPGGIAIGEAHLNALQQYANWAGRAGFGPYDEKALGILTVYGLPMARVRLPNDTFSPASAEWAVAQATPARGANASINATATTQQYVVTPDFDLVETAAGDYYAIDGDRQARPGLPVMPRTGIDLPANAHGVLFLSGTTVDEPFAPLVTGLSAGEDDIRNNETFDGWFPLLTSAINRLELERETQARLVVIPAQYRDGTLRRFTSLTYEVSFSAAADRTPPEIRVVEALETAGGVAFRVVVGADDRVTQVYATWTEEGSGQWQSTPLTYVAARGRWEGQVTSNGPLTYFIQAVDEDGDTAALVNKGRLFQATPGVTNEPPNPPVNPSPATGSTGVSPATALAWSATDPDGDALTYDVRFGASNPPSTVVTSQSATTYDPPGNLTGHTTYTWQIVAKDAAHPDGTPGPVWQFTTANTAPTAPGSPNPANGATSVAVAAQICWTAGTDGDGDAVTYDVAFGTTNPPPSASTGQSATCYDPPGNLTAGTLYYWKVTAKDAFGGATAGPVWSFTTAGGAFPDVFYLSPSANVTIGGVAAQGADVLRYTKSTNTWQMVFDGSNHALTKNISAFTFLDDGSLLFVLAANQTIAGLGAVTPYDVVKFTPNTPGVFPLGSGTYSWYAQLKPKGLTTAGEKIDAIDVVGNRLLLSTGGAASVPKPGGGVLKPADEDVFVYNLGTGAFEITLLIDGSKMPGMAVEDITGIWDDPQSSDYYITIVGAFNLGGVKGNDKSIVKLTPNGGASVYTPSLESWLAAGATLPTGFKIDGLEMAR